MERIGDFKGGTGTASVMSMVQARAAMQYPAIAQIEAYWEGLRAAGSVPFRSEIDPRGIDRALENAFVLERVAAGVARFRLAGMHLNDLMGMEVRGMPITAFFTPDARRKISDALEHLFEQPARIRIRLVGEVGIGKAPIRGELLLLPLKSDLGDISRALGCLVTEGKIGRTPRRFNVENVEICGLDDSVWTRPPAIQKRPVQTPVSQPGFAETSPPFAGVTQTSKPSVPDTGSRPARPYLRLIHSSDPDE